MRMRGTQVVSELDPEAIVVSVDGISAFDLISRRAMLSDWQELRAARRFSHS